MKILHTPKAGAFTLLELLTAIAIIAILTTLLFVSVKGVMVRSRQTETTARMQAVYHAMIAYVNDHSTRLPVCYSAGRDGMGRTIGTIGAQLLKDGYLTPKSEPGDCSALGCRQQLSQWPSAPTKYTFGMNNRIGDFPAADAKPLGARRMTQVQRPPLTSFIMHGVWNGNGFSAGTSENYAQVVKPVFGDSVLVCYMDGHVSLVRISEIPQNLTSQEGKDFWLGGQLTSQ